MSRPPLLKRYVRDLRRMGLSVLMLCVLAVAGFNAVEIWEHVDTREEELQELLVIVLILFATFPVILLLAGRTAKRLLKPLLNIELGIKMIRAGELQTRIPTDATEEELAYLAESINAAFDAHRHVREQLERFSGNVSHQLRTPLTALRTEGELCLRQNRDVAGCRESLGRMLESCERMTHLVEQLLLLARVSAQEPGKRFQQVDLRALTEEVLLDYRLLIEDRPGEVDIHVPAYPVLISGNTVWLGEAIRNLVNNALTHVAAEAPLRIALSQFESEICLCMEDGGIGISPSRQKNLARRFEKTEPLVDSSGTGLGLSIISEIAHLHGGHLGYKPSALGGACFQLIFPAARL